MTTERLIALWDKVKRWARIAWAEHPGAILGVPVGAIAGWFGAILGFLLGWMIDTLVSQTRADRAIIEYLETPGLPRFRETEPGTAAACALFMLILRADRKSGRRIDEIGVSRAARYVSDSLRTDAETFPELETYARVALSRLDRLNSDLLTESLCARLRGKALRAAPLASAFEAAAEGPRSRALAEKIAAAIAPDRPVGGSDRARGGVDDDPYKLLGVTPETPIREVKNVFRRLAVQFHPDSLIGLGVEREKSAAEAFMKIRDAYREILRRSKER